MTNSEELADTHAGRYLLQKKTSVVRTTVFLVWGGLYENKTPYKFAGSFFL